jgi:hypothetical protein
MTSTRHTGRCFVLSTLADSAPGYGASLISLVDRARMRPPTEAAQTEAPAERKARLGPRYRALPRGRLRESHLFRKMTILSGLRLQPQEMQGPLENQPPHGLEPAWPSNPANTPLQVLAGFEANPAKAGRPGVIGHWTNNIVYKRLAPGVWEELKRLTPRTPSRSYTSCFSGSLRASPSEASRTPECSRDAHEIFAQLACIHASARC